MQFLGGLCVKLWDGRLKTEERKSKNHRGPEVQTKKNLAICAIPWRPLRETLGRETEDGRKEKQKPQRIGGTEKKNFALFAIPWRPLRETLGRETEDGRKEKQKPQRIGGTEKINIALFAIPWRPLRETLGRETG
ncbi:hypothetical protein KIH41_15425 [Litoribacter ruber]|uniref:hypothetical protein n=1 Tax=Litoribacter ruber TaxID=702568 RepID=UPI001BDA8B00|nr:hypothetical protein [Litoribacter ruber]MBT0812679.1 hypothetical protein [Litoribacter ruber]